MATSMKPASTCLTAAAAVLALSACASASATYPSLARRDVERVSGSALPVPPEPSVPAVPAPPSEELSARLAQLVEQARAAHARFDARRERTARLVAAGAGTSIASEAWAVASVALADLESARSETMVALAELDQLHAADRVSNYNAESGDGVAIAASRDRVLGWIGEEDQVLAALRGRLGG